MDREPEEKKSRSADASHGARKMLAELASAAMLPIEQKLNRCDDLGAISRVFVLFTPLPYILQARATDSGHL